MKEIYVKLLTDNESIWSYLENVLEIDISCCQIVNSVVNCSQSINITNNKMQNLGVQFGEIKGDFICNYCDLDNLWGMPYHVEGNFSCISNNLTNLEYAPKYVGGSFDCSRNEITSLKFAPENIAYNFDCSRNRITSFEYCPKIIKGYFDCSYNLFSSFKHCPEIIEGDASFSHNNISSLEYFPKEIKGELILKNNPILSLNHLPTLTNRDQMNLHIYLPLLSAYNTQSAEFTFNLYDYELCSYQERQVNLDNLEFHAKIFRKNRSDGYFHIGYRLPRKLYPTLADKCKALYKAWPWLYIEFCKYEPVLLEHFDYRTKE